MVDKPKASRFEPPDWLFHLLSHLESHVRTEHGLLETYSMTAQQTESKAFRYLVNLLIEDETRHHRLFSELVDSLKTATTYGKDPTIPYLDFDRADHALVLDGTEELLTIEEEDVRELKQLQQELRAVKDTTLWSLLVELMQRDTQKHIAILRFVQNHAR
jgi:rubrerythrin